ncbi:hypothetical protein MLGJGCBP_02548 [Rhodococcus sp. T7]|nr:hypothetical protein MLGJGCBP_02548 [Rhodococcus sp. T7]
MNGLPHPRHGTFASNSARVRYVPFFSHSSRFILSHRSHSSASSAWRIALAAAHCFFCSSVSVGMPWTVAPITVSPLRPLNALEPLHVFRGFRMFGVGWSLPNVTCPDSPNGDRSIEAPHAYARPCSRRPVTGKRSGVLEESSPVTQPRKSNSIRTAMATRRSLTTQTARTAATPSSNTTTPKWKPRNFTETIEAGSHATPGQQNRKTQYTASNEHRQHTASVRDQASTPHRNATSTSTNSTTPTIGKNWRFIATDQKIGAGR